MQHGIRLSMVFAVVTVVGGCERGGEPTTQPGASSPDPRPAEPAAPAPAQAAAQAPAPEPRPLEFVLIPGGSLNGRELPAFELLRTEVTVAQYRACVEAHVCATPATVYDDPRWRWTFNWDQPGRDEHPINGVSWHDATAYCAWVGGRLPTERQWVWAARGRSEGRTHPWGAAPPSPETVNACGTECTRATKESSGLDWHAAYAEDDGWPATAPVGSKPAGASRDGVHDLLGNVWEWTDGWLYDEQHGARLLLGGAWDAEYVTGLTVAARNGNDPHTKMSTYGFRCVRTLPTEPASEPAPAAGTVDADPDFDPAEVEKIFRKRKHELMTCAKHESQRHVTVKVTLSSTGQVLAVVPGSSNSKLDSCIEDVVETWTFPAPGREFEFEFSVMF